VILVDANLLLYAHNRSAPEHAAARAWFERALSGPDRIGVPWPSILAFVRLASNPVVFRQPITPASAWQVVRQWLRQENVWIPTPGTTHGEIFESLLADRRVTSRMVPDAHLAALAIEHGLTLCSTDGDFTRFAGLRWNNPLQLA
jgi:toxin-antitoxin system PIN domain toxin